MDRPLQRHKAGEVSFLRGGEGQTFLFLHGIPGSAFAWEKTGELLTDHYQVIIPDLLGFGQSDMPKDDYYMEFQAKVLRQLLVELGVRSLYIGGHDFGGPVAITLMRLFPDLTINGLVLSATNMFTDTYVPPPLRVANIPILNTLVFKAMVGNRIGLRMMYLAATKEKAEASWEQFNRHLTPSGIDFTRRIFQRSLADLRANYQAVEGMLSRIACPTLILWGANDPFFATPVGERTRNAIPGAMLRIYEHTGHFVPEEQPAHVARDIMEYFASKKS